MNPRKGRFCNRNLAEGKACKVNPPKRRPCEPVPTEGGHGTCWEQSFTLGGRWAQTPLPAPTSVLLRRLLGFLESQLPSLFIG